MFGTLAIRRSDSSQGSWDDRGDSKSETKVGEVCSGNSTFCIPTELRYMCDTNCATSCLSVALCAPCLASELCGSRSVRDAHQWQLVVVLSDVI